MKLELKHIAPYLPYGLTSVNYFDGIELKRKIVPSNIMGFVDGDTNAKPILRPLSDLTKEIKVNGEKFVPIEFIEEKYYTQNWANQLSRCIEDEKWIYHLDYSLILSLLEWHFDVFGLIENNLAIDINTL